MQIHREAQPQSAFLIGGSLEAPKASTSEMPCLLLCMRASAWPLELHMCISNETSDPSPCRDAFF